MSRHVPINLALTIFGLGCGHGSRSIDPSVRPTGPPTRWRRLRHLERPPHSRRSLALAPAGAAVLRILAGGRAARPPPRPAAHRPRGGRAAAVAAVDAR